MENIGQFLKELRVKNNYSIDDLANKTKVRPNIIKDIENNKLSDLFESGHLKIFIHTIAKSLDASAHEIKQLSDNIDKTFSRSVADSNVKIEHHPPRKVMISSNFFYSIFLVIIFVILTSIIIYFYQQGTISFNILKDELFVKTEVKKSEKKDQITNTPTDSVWVKQKKVLEEKSKLSQSKKNIIDNFKVLYDSTDYIGDILFNNEDSAFNPRI
jgi:cytoskeletal protein RodZ